MGKIILVTGGARSGKSTFAEKYVAAQGQAVTYIATSEILDEEMQERVSLHRDRRPSSWRTMEAPRDAEIAVSAAVQSSDAVLFDCLTLYLSNLLFGPEASEDRMERSSFVMRKIDALLTEAKGGRCPVVFVTNEVGMGIVPDNAMAREYRDVAGLVNQRVAAAADEVYLTIHGLAVELKRLAVEVERLNH